MIFKLFHSPLSLSSRGFLVPLHYLELRPLEAKSKTHSKSIPPPCAPPLAPALCRGWVWWGSRKQSSHTTKVGVGTPPSGATLPGLSLGGSSYLWIRRRHCLRGALKVTHRRQSPAFCPAQRTLALICARFTFCLKHVLQRGSRLLSLVREDAPGQLSPRTTTTEPVPLSPCSSTREATAVRSPRTAARE